MRVVPQAELMINPDGTAAPFHTNALYSVRKYYTNSYIYLYLYISSYIKPKNNTKC